MQKRRLVRMVSLGDLLLAGISGWFIQKILDFLLKKGKRRLHLTGKSHLSEYVMMFGQGFMMTEFTIMPGYLKTLGNLTEEQRLLRTLLRGHKRFHKITGSKRCYSCSVINEYKRDFERIVADPELYPPF